jgi:hypothetical protein
MMRRSAPVTMVVSSAALATIAALGTFSTPATGLPPAPAATAVTTTIAGQVPVFEPVDFFGDFYFQINADPYEAGDLSKRVVAGSPAEAFVTYVLGFGAARIDSRQGPFEPFTVDATTTPIEGDPAVDVCSDGVCDMLSGFVVADDRLQSFLLNGVPIDDRVAAPSKATMAGDVGLRVVGAFERVTVDELAVVIAVDPGAETLSVPWDEVFYVDPSGDEIPVDLAASAYPAEIAPRADGQDQPIVLQFPTAQLGGELVLTFTTDASTPPVEARVTIDELRP